MLRAIAFLAVSYLAVAEGAITKASYTGKQGLDDYASKVGKYMGTATDLNPTDTYYTTELKNGHEFGMVTPGNAMKVRQLGYLVGNEGRREC